MSRDTKIGSVLSRKIVETITFIYQSGMTTTSGGNVSSRGEEGEVWITPAGVDKGSLTPEDTVCIKADGSCDGQHRPSSENPIHRSIYRLRSDVGAIIHAHPEALVAYALASQSPNLDALPQAKQICGEIIFAPYELPGSEKLGNQIASLLAKDKEVKSIIMENHGVVVVGKDLEEALERFQTLEFAARTLIHAREIGEVQMPELLAEQIANESQYREPVLGWVLSEKEKNLRGEVCKLVARACKQGLMISTYGTVSMRANDDGFVITPSGKSRMELTEADLVCVDHGKAISGGRPSRSINLHAAIYKKFPDINCIITTQTPAISAHAVVQKVIDVHTNPESWVFVRDISMLPYGIQFEDAPAVPDSLSPDFPVAIIENDSVIAIGHTAIQTFDRIEVAEFTAKSNIQAARIGGANRISEERIAELKAAFMS